MKQPPAPITPDRILLADDDGAFREAYAELLRRHGYDCLCAPDGETAVRLLGEMEFDALVADIHMPGNRGLELIESVPKIARGLPVILLTGRPSVETAARSVRLAVIAYLVKPPEIDELLSLLREAIPRGRRLRAVSQSRKHLQNWAQELADVEENLRRPAGAVPSAAPQDYLRVTLHNLVLQVADLDRSIAAWSRFDPAAADLQKLDLVSAVRHAIEVLEKTRQNFRSKELGELRKKLQTLLPPAEP